MTTSDPEAAIELVTTILPQLAIIAMDTSTIVASDLCRRLRRTPLSRSMPVIVLGRGPGSQDGVAALEAGADDYVRHPFDPEELLARVKRSLVRWRSMRAINPLSNLPGNVDLMNELERRIDSREAVALLYIDLDNFKAFNDRYGFSRGDVVLKLLATCLTEAIRGHPTAFAGHIGGDDFVIVVETGVCEDIATELVRLWKLNVKRLYHPDDAERGYIEVTHRKGNQSRIDLLSISIGIATTDNRSMSTPAEFAQVASETKQAAKLKLGSGFLRDRRSAENGNGSRDPVDAGPRSDRVPTPPP